MALRPEEQAELRYRDVELKKGVVWIRRAASELCTGERAVGDPSRRRASGRSGSLPSSCWSSSGTCAGTPRRERTACSSSANAAPPFSRSTFGRKWRKARKKLGLDHLRFYDLRHTGNVLAASTGASLRDLIAFMGHNSPRAALIYQHSTEEQQTKISDGISAAVVDIRSARRWKATTDGSETLDMPRQA
ncbi:tyrosine-type recombinase/integrase [Kitasatospora sp. NPDC059408]|uniref:tyrosine-type recombinase/integrase n=1 Tax=Kitasatospora sp. NPDC059408 TaxID=3346823 RepID=UPI00367CD039